MMWGGDKTKDPQQQVQALPQLQASYWRVEVVKPHGVLR